MSRAKSKRRWDSCIRKRKHETLPEANKARLRIAGQNYKPVILQTYPCMYCTGWHLTSHSKAIDK